MAVDKNVSMYTSLNSKNITDGENICDNAGAYIEEDGNVPNLGDKSIILGHINFYDFQASSDFYVL